MLYDFNKVLQLAGVLFGVEKALYGFWLFLYGIGAGLRECPARKKRCHQED